MKAYNSGRLITLYIFILTGLFVALFPSTVNATPAFARQTGMNCASCHFQHYPALNAFGRSFKQGGYTMLGGQSMIEGKGSSLPIALNAALVGKLRYQKTNGSDKTVATNTGDLQFPDEAALFIGGRGNENIGFLTEISLKESGANNNFNSFKIHFNYPINGTNYGAVVFLTDAGGAPYGFELLNTGAQRFIRVAEERSATAAQQFISGTGSPGSSDAEGIAFVASQNNFFVNATLWSPNHGSVALDSPATYLRAVYMPVLGTWDIGIGAQLFTGTARRTNTTTGLSADVDTDAWFIDGQAQGELGGKPVGFYVTYGTADAGTNNYFNSNPNDQTAWSVLAEYGIMPKKMTIYLGYLNGDNGKATNNTDRRLTIGGTWMLAQNVELQLWNTSYSGSAYNPEPGSGDSLTSLMLFFGF